jgi:hypothetical protein
MAACRGCGKVNPDHYKFCLGCGRELAPSAADEAGDDHQVERVESSRPRPASTMTLRMNVQCAHCAQPIPVNGPARQVQCGACLHDTRLPDLAEVLHTASRGYETLGSRYGYDLFSSRDSQCVGCGTSVEIDTYLSANAPGLVPCPKCAVGVPIAPAPDWLREALPNVAWVFGGSVRSLPPAAAAALDVGQHEVEPIAMACPQCGGGLTITQDDERTVACRFCSVNVFLPDELWRRLHPVPTMRTWTVTWSGPALHTAEELAELAQAEDGRQQRRLEAARSAPGPTRTPDSSPEADALPGPDPAGATLMFVVGLALAGLLVAGIVVAFI